MGKQAKLKKAKRELRNELHSALLNNNINLENTNKFEYDAIYNSTYDKAYKQLKNQLKS